MKKYRIYIAIGTVFVLVYFIVQLAAPHYIDWRHTYTSKDKIPYGTSALFDILTKLPPYKDMQVVHQPIYNQLQSDMAHWASDDSGHYSIKADSPTHSYIFIYDELRLSELDINKLLKNVSQGNNAFIAANELNGLDDSLHIHINRTYDLDDINEVSIRDQKYHYHRLLYSRSVNSIDSMDTATTHIIGYINKQPDFICVKYGLGRFYINTTPELFTNYYVVNDTTYQYAFNSLAELNTPQFLWDEYYKTGRRESDNILRYIVSQPALRIAWYIVLLTMIAYTVFESKRRQKPIAILAPLRNDSLEFAKTLGAFYFKTSEHKNIAEKKWRILNEYIRTKYNIACDLNDTTLADKLSRKTGYPQDKVNEMLDYVNLVMKSRDVSAQLLIDLNQSVNSFYTYIYTK